MIRKWKKRNYRDGDRRTIKRFALLPCFVSRSWDDRVDKEMRWLKIVYVQQKFYAGWGDACWWTNEHFVTEAEYIESLNNDAEILGDLR